MVQSYELILTPLFYHVKGLDPPLLLYFPPLVIRTFLRLFRLRPPCAPGFEEQEFSAPEKILSDDAQAITNEMKST